MSTLRPVLVVDDSQSNLDLAVLVLQRELGNPTVHVARSAMELAKTLSRCRFGVAICDHHLEWARPGEVLELIREAQPGCALVVFTEVLDAEVAAHAIRLGVDGCATKDSSGFLALGETVRHALFKARRRELATAADTPYRRVFEGLPMGVFLATAESEILEANPALASILGCERPDELSRRRLDRLFVSTAVAADWRSQLETSGGLASLEAEVRRSDGDTVWVRMNAWVVEEPGGGARQLHGTVEEIQAAHSAREELARRTVALAQSNADLEQFAYVVSHDLQQPLNTISRHLELLADEIADGAIGEGGRFLAHARQGAEYMQRMLDAILRYSRIETRGEAMAATPLGDVLGRVLDRLGDEIEAAGAVVTADPLPTVRADAAQMEQLLTNLLANALKFTGESPPEIHIGASDHDREWVVSVRDNGIGIDPSARERIFNMFQRLHTREEVPGTGIGLAICKRIVARHGGRIWVESKPGEGSTFFVALPKERESDPPTRQGG